MTNLIEVSETNFPAEVLESPVPVLVDFFADYCGPCKSLKPVLEELAADLDGRAKIVTVDVVASDDLTAKYDINVVPTLIVFRNGKEAQRLIGLAKKSDLQAALLG